MLEGSRLKRHLWQCVILLSCMQVLYAERLIKHNKLIVILLDGCRWDYIQDPSLTGFRKMFKGGVKAEYLNPAFPTLSFPNYYSIMTGLYTETHGMVGNNMYDPKHNASFLMGQNPEHKRGYWWEGGDPLWITAARQERRSYMYHWPGCEVEIKEFNATYCKPYSAPPSDKEFHDSLENGLAVLQNGTADFVGVYYEQTDHIAHLYGPNSPQVKDVVKKVDEQLMWLLDEVDRRLMDDVNVMVLSDHGQTEISMDRTVYLADFAGFSLDDVELIIHNTVQSIWPKEGKLDKVYQSLKDKNPHLSVYKREELPERWHYKNSDRVAPITLVPSLGFTIIFPGDKWTRRNESNEYLKGHHGYDDMEADMRGIFTAIGPNFKKNTTVGGFYNVEVYQIMCWVLGLYASTNNGTWATVKPFLEMSAGGYQTPEASSFSSLYYTVGIATGGALCVCVCLFIAHNVANHRRFRFRNLDNEQVGQSEALMHSNDDDDDAL